MGSVGVAVESISNIIRGMKGWSYHPPLTLSRLLIESSSHQYSMDEW